MRLLTVLTDQKDRLFLSRYFGYVIILTAAALAALLHVISKPLLDYSSLNMAEINPITLAAIIYIINGLFFTPLTKKNPDSVGKIDKKNLFLLTVIGIAEVSAIITYFFGLKESTAVNASILTNGEILFSILVAITVLRERLHKKEAPAFFLIIAGIILLPVVYDLYNNGMVLTDLVFGNLLIILSGVFVAIDINLCRYVNRKIGPKKITQVVSFVGAGFAFGLIAIFQIPFDVSVAHLPGIAIIGIFGTGMATFFFLIALRLIGTVRTVLLYSTTSTFGVIFAAILLQESITLQNVFSIILVTAGLYLLRNRLGTIEKSGSLEHIASKPAGSNFDKLCTSCTHQGCCTSFASPLLFSHDLNELKKIGKDGEEFVKEIEIHGINVKTLKKKHDSNICVFWDEDKKMCSIYKNRPFDCRAYPFDIHFIDGKYHWIVYSCNPKSNWEWSEKYLQMLENDKQFNEVMGKIDAYSDLTQINKLEKSKQYPFTVLRQIRYKTNYIL